MKDGSSDSTGSYVLVTRISLHEHGWYRGTIHRWIQYVPDRYTFNLQWCVRISLEGSGRLRMDTRVWYFSVRRSTRHRINILGPEKDCCSLEMMIGSIRADGYGREWGSAVYWEKDLVMAGLSTDLNCFYLFLLYVSYDIHHHQMSAWAFLSANPGFRPLIL
jgi:hypothetical protein